MLTRQTLAAGLGIGTLLLIGFSAAVSNGLLAAGLPTEFLSFDTPKEGCETDLTAPGPSMSFADVHPPIHDLIIPPNAGEYCSEAPSIGHTL